MILIDVIIAERVNELANFQPTNMRDQMSQQGIGTDIERHAEKRIGRTLIELTVKQRGTSPTVREGSSLLNLELKQSVTGRQVDVIAFARVPAADDQTARIRIRFDLVKQTRDLIDSVKLRIMTAK